MLSQNRTSQHVQQSLAHHLLHLRNRHFVTIDIIIFLVTPLLALYLRTDQLTPYRGAVSTLVLYTTVALLTRMSFNYAFGMYRRYWRFAGAIDFAELVLANSLALFITACLFIIITVGWPDYFTLPRSLPLIDAMLGLLLVGGVRASVRLTENVRARPMPTSLTPLESQRTLIVGAGYTGALLARELRDNSQIHLELIGFVDDDKDKQGMQLHNVRVLGNQQMLPALLRDGQIERVIIAMPSAPGKVIREIAAICQQAGVTVQTMPGVHELLNGNVSISRLRNIQIEDLLRRTPIQTDIAAVRTLLVGKRVLVTGGGGSIGSELCRQILRCGPAQLVLVGHGENSIFEISNELQRQLASEGMTYAGKPTVIKPIIADLRFRDRLFGIFAAERPQVVFHAAAHKHVPLMEGNVVEAITNNVLGTRLLLAAAERYDVERFVMISTDKAVNPTNVMGASKRAAELLVLSAARRTGRFYQVVRFGNVLGSRGSVLHTFKAQIAAGGPVTVTDPEMVRYFMTIPEAVQLVLQASVVGQGGQVLMLDMGDPVRIVDLAHDLIELSGLQVGRDIEINFSGLRPGEKLYEEMFTAGEDYQRTQHAKIFMAHNASTFVPPRLDSDIDNLVTAALADDGNLVVTLLAQLLPEYQPWEGTISAVALPVSAVRTTPNSQPLTLTPALGSD